MDKRELRKHIRALKKMMTDEERQRQSEMVCRKVMSHPRWQSAKTVLLYHALPDEVDTAWLIKAFLDEDKAWPDTPGEKKCVLLPVVVGDELELRVFDGKLRQGAFGILEPSHLSELFTDYASIDLAVIPGMAFDKAGNRLGRGKGYYDKTLCRLPNAYRMGVCFDFQFVDEVPSEEHDIRMDEIICL